MSLLGTYSSSDWVRSVSKSINLGLIRERVSTVSKLQAMISTKEGKKRSDRGERRLREERYSRLWSQPPLLPEG